MSPQTKTTRPSGAFGLTQVTLTPQQRKQGLDLDVRNCPHCGVHHASLPGAIENGQVSVVCPSLGRRLTLTLKLFPHPL